MLRAMGYELESWAGDSRQGAARGTPDEVEARLRELELSWLRVSAHVQAARGALDEATFLDGGSSASSVERLRDRLLQARRRRQAVAEQMAALERVIGEEDIWR